MPEPDWNEWERQIANSEPLYVSLAWDGEEWEVDTNAPDDELVIEALIHVLRRYALGDMKWNDPLNP